MAEKIDFLSWRFERDLRAAWHHETGEAVRFTRVERALLNTLIENSGRVLQRDALLDAVAGLDGDIADRSIDFIIHRLRRKLRDEPRDPRYIATQYGEGYVWVAESTSSPQSAADAFLVIGPIRGLDFVEQLAERGWLFARTLGCELDRGTSRHNRVVVDSQHPSWDADTDRQPQFALVLDFIETENGGLDCALALRYFRGHNTAHSRRISVCGPGDGAATAEQAAQGMAKTLLDDIWHTLQAVADNDATPDDVLPDVGLHEASERLTGTRTSWLDAQQRLRRSLRERPDDARTQLMLASALRIRYVLAPPAQPIPAATRRHDEAEIERLVLVALPEIKKQSVFALIAAKLLYFVNKAHRQMALELAEDAFASTTAFANAFAVVGQLRMWEGDLHGAMKLYDQGLALTRHGGYFQRYILVLKMHAELALKCDHSASAETLFSIVPEERGELGLLWAPVVTDAVRTDVDAFMDGLDGVGATAVIRHQHYLAARHFHHHKHRQNVLRRPVDLLLERFDSSVIPSDIRPDVPTALLR